MADHERDEVLEALRSGRALKGARLDFLNLDGEDLSGAILRGANLVFASFQNAILRQADLRDANLAFARLKGADLTGANLEGAVLANAVLGEAVLRQANLVDVHLGFADLYRADLRSSRAPGACCAGRTRSTRTSRRRISRGRTWPEPIDGRAGDAFHEERLYRHMHPMMAKRLELWRLANFDVERLPSVEDLYLFRGVARTNPRDERLFAFAEVRDLTPVRSDGGRLLRLPSLEMALAEALGGIRLVQSNRGARERLHWNRILLYVWPPLDLQPGEANELAQRLLPSTGGLGLEKVVLRARTARAPDGELRDTVLEFESPGGHEVAVHYRDPPTIRSSPSPPTPRRWSAPVDSGSTTPTRSCGSSPLPRARRSPVYPRARSRSSTSTTRAGSSRWSDPGVRTGRTSWWGSSATPPPGTPRA